FDDYFYPELEGLKYLENDGLVNVTVDQIQVTSMGRLLMRSIAVLFDTYSQLREEKKYSQAV
ncbi:MAG TPA: coproporphyrinogen III oxidase, partial [Cyanobacteria bacterium UBA12227]|nr:coproporphyrinogen III oxidase [Cyanobacteria bacterium UBA12227]